MKKSKIWMWLLPALLAIVACDKDILDQVNPNAPTTETFWQTEADAIVGLNAVYSGIQNRELSLWEIFLYDMRADEGYSQSPWTDLANVGRFVNTNYDLPWLLESWRELYRTIYKANQVLENVPGIEMDETVKARILAEAKFLRGHCYYKLATLWGRVPMVTDIQDVDTRYPQGTVEEVWSLVEQDFIDAAVDLPISYTGEDIGRATKGGAIAYLGKSYLQQKKWTEAAAEFQKIIDMVPGTYDLMAEFKDNFTTDFENNKESLFEIQFTNNNGKTSGFPTYNNAGGDETSERAQFFGVRPLGWTDGQPTKWLLNQFLIELDRDGNIDSRLQYTMAYDHPGELLYGLTYAERQAGPNDRFWRKYTNYWQDFESYFSGINTRVIRLADVYLMQAEALNELGRTPEAIPYANLVRERSNMNSLPLTLSQNDFRLQLRHDRIVELAGESVRFNDMIRYGIASPDLAGPDPGLSPAESDFDTEFQNFVIGKSEYLPIPLREIDAYGGSLQQNPGW